MSWADDLQGSGRRGGGSGGYPPLSVDDPANWDTAQRGTGDPAPRDAVLLPDSPQLELVVELSFDGVGWAKYSMGHNLGNFVANPDQIGLLASTPTDQGEVTSHWIRVR